MQTVLRVEFETTNIIIAVALLLAPPFFIFFGHMSDKIGFKKIIMSGCLIAALSYNPIYRTMTAASGWDPANPLAPAFNPSVPELIGLVFIQVFFVTMLYGPSAAF